MVAVMALRALYRHEVSGSRCAGSGRRMTAVAKAAYHAQLSVCAMIGREKCGLEVPGFFLYIDVQHVHRYN